MISSYRFAHPSWRFTGQEYPADAGTPVAAVTQAIRWKGRWFSDYAGGIYDVRARVWSPELGTFLSIDEYAYHDVNSTLWGWPGQNPIRWADPSGHDYGDKFNTELAAVLDVERIYGQRSQAEKREYGTLLYEDANGKFSYLEPTKSFPGFANEVTLPSGVSPSMGRRVSSWHYHWSGQGTGGDSDKCMPNKGNQKLSPRDIRTAIRDNDPSWLSTAAGLLIKYNPPPFADFVDRKNFVDFNPPGSTGGQSGWPSGYVDIEVYRLPNTDALLNDVACAGGCK